MNLVIGYVIHPHRLISLLSIILLSLLCSCVKQDTDANELDKLRFLEGTWNSVPLSFNEYWEYDDGKLEGKAYKAVENDTQVTETLRIEWQDDSIDYVALVPDQNDSTEVKFRMQHHEEDSFVFLNTQHDFPKGIVYVKLNDTLLNVFLLGEKLEAAHKIILVKSLKYEF